MHGLFYPDVPHQYCHFHFLQNIWNHLEAMDGHLHKELAKAVSHLYITSVSKSSKVKVKGAGRKYTRDVFSEIEKDLRKLVKNSSKKFDKLRCIETWEKLSSYIRDIKQECKQEDPSRWIVISLLKTADRIQDTLDEMRGEYDVCVALNKRFQVVRALLGDPVLSRDDRAKDLDKEFQIIWEKANTKVNLSSKDELQSSKLEQKFGKEKMIFFSRCAKKQVGMQVRIRGNFILKELHVDKEEIRSILASINVDYDDGQLKSGMEELECRTKQETDDWKSNIGGIDAIKRVLEIGKKTKIDKQHR